MGRLNALMRVYLDSNAVIEAVEGLGPARDRMRRILNSAPTSTTSLVTSDLTLAETIVGPLKSLKASVHDDAAVEFLSAYISLFEEEAAIETIGIARSTLSKAAQLRSRHDALKLPDAIHLATAVASNCDTLISDDRQLRAKAGLEGIGVCSLDPADLDALLSRIASAQ